MGLSRRWAKFNGFQENSSASKDPSGRSPRCWPCWMSSDGGFSMMKSIRSLALGVSFSFFSLGAAAADIQLAAVTPSASGQHVQELGRIEAAASYDATVWRQLARQARHPDRGSASPRRLNGTVDVAFEVAPDGSPKQAAIARSSLSNALDGAALRSVERARFQPTPPSAQGELPRRYLVTFDYRY
jgi:TonB family protein